MPRRWIAVLLSFLSPGLGHVYSGRAGRAICIFGGLELLVVALNWLFAAGPVNVALLLAVSVAAIAIAVVIALDAYRAAGRGRLRFHGRAARWGACLGFFLFSVLAGVWLEAVRERSLGEPLRIPSEGMLPTLVIGDHFFTNPLSYRSRAPRRGDVVIITVARDGSATFPADQRPELPHEQFVKRIVGVPGDRVAFSGARLLVNGERVTAVEPEGEFVDRHGQRLLVLSEKLDGHQYQILDSPAVSLPDAGPFVVEPGRYFVAGDNRDHSNDSRFFGTISREHVIAPTSRIYWSWDFNGTYVELASPARVVELLKSHTRWTRIGLPIN